MASYAFETIAPAEASGFDRAVDGLGFTTPGHRGALATVLYQPDGGVSVSLAGRTVLFGAGLPGARGVAFSDGSELFVGSAGGDVWTGTAAGDGAYGGAGDDELSGGAGDDLLQGNQGRDTLTGGAGADTVYGGQGDDVIDVGAGVNFGQGNLGSDLLRAAADAGRTTLLGGQGDDSLAGGGEADFLNGNSGADSIFGGGGGDVLLGEGGADTLEGGAGADTITGGEGADVFVFRAGASDAAAVGTFLGEVVDRIQDWERTDRIDYPGGPLPTPERPGIDPSYYYELSPATVEADADYYGPFGPPHPFDYWGARDESVRLMRQNPTLDVIAVQADNDVLIFIDLDGGDAPDLAIRLVRVTLADIAFDNFI